MWDLAQKLGYTNKNGGIYRTIRQNLDRRDIEIPKWGKRTRTTYQKTDEEIFCENSSYDRKDLKKRIISQNLLDVKCSECGIIDWNGKPLTLQLDHINGVNKDNRIENLRFMCPNCHSQTSTWGTRNILNNS